MRHPKLALIDDGFPHVRPVGFSGRKHAEFIALLELVPEAATVCPPASFTKGRDAEAFRRDRDRLLRKYPQIDSSRIIYCEDLASLCADLAYCVFPSYAHRLLPWFESNRIPFTFTVYPGGGFVMWGKNVERSDQRLKSLFESEFFRGVFVHHAIIRRYLEDKYEIGDRILYSKGGFTQFDDDMIQPKTHYGFDRAVLNICFVANRYDDKGLGKGYDIFIETARRLHILEPNCHFHVVGDWGPQIIDVSAFDERISFHGYLNPNALSQLYSAMDVILSPTRIDIPAEGKFDGFPLVIDAGMCGVGMFVTDPLGQNEDFTPGEDLEIIRADPDDAVARLLPYSHAPEMLKALGLNGQARIKILRSKQEKVGAKAAVLSSLVGNKSSR